MQFRHYPRWRHSIVNSLTLTFIMLLSARLVFLFVTTVVCSDYSSSPQTLYNATEPELVLSPKSISFLPSSQSQLFVWLRHNRHRLLRNVPLYSDRKAHRMTLLLISGIHPNPGPRRPKYPCGVCGYACKTGVLGCDDCGQWIHKECVGISSSLLSRLGDSSDPWFCPSCSSKNTSSKIFTLPHATIQNVSPASPHPTQPASPPPSTPVDSSALRSSLESSADSTSISHSFRQTILSLSENDTSLKVIS